jgi:hypothetical protein
MVAPLAKSAPFTVRLNLPIGIVSGAIDAICGEGFSNVMEALAFLVASAVSVAPIVTLFGDGGNSGAVYAPAAEIMPTDPFPPAAPFTDQLTTSDIPLILAASPSVAPPRSVAEDGVIASCPGGGCGPAPPFVSPVQPTRSAKIAGTGSHSLYTASPLSVQRAFQFLSM